MRTHLLVSALVVFAVAVVAICGACGETPAKDTRSSDGPHDERQFQKLIGKAYDLSGLFRELNRDPEIDLEGAKALATEALRNARVCLKTG
jgi:hypothetical protein